MSAGTAERPVAAGGMRWGLLAALAAGVVLRVLLVMAAPRFGYVGDHFDVIGMGMIAESRGITRVYSASQDELPLLHGWVYRNGERAPFDRRCAYVPNYPPLCQLVFWAQAAWLGAQRPDFEVNTVYTRLVTSLAPWVFEMLTALGVALLAGTLTGVPRLGTAAGIATWLAPPLMMNAALFGQYDALALAPGVFAVLAMVRGHWVRTGVCVGLGLLSKPQGLLMVPIAAFAACLAAFAPSPDAPGPRGIVRAVRQLAAIGGGALVTILVGSAPWMLADGFAWVERCYRANLVDVLPFTTLEAYNVWYLLALVSERHPLFDILSSTATVGGLSRDAWGRLLLAAAFALTGLLCWARVRRRPTLAIVLFAGLALWAVFIWPTRVHERYILYSVPLMIVAATAVPRLRPFVAALVLVATMEHSWMIWRTAPPLGTFDRRWVEQIHHEQVEAYWHNRPMTAESIKTAPTDDDARQAAFERYRAERRRSDRLEWLLTLLSLGAYAAAVGVVLRGAPATLAAPGDDSVADRMIASA